MPAVRSSSTVGSTPAGPVGADPQGGRYHLLVGASDWATCEGTGPGADLEFDPGTGSLRLAHREAVTRRPPTGAARGPEQRRGADRDRYGAWYRVSDDRRGIVRLGSGARAATSWWCLDDLDAACHPPPGSDGGFAAAAGPSLDDGAGLAGLAVTAGHHLVAGLEDDQGGLLLFDLHAGGAPLVLRWPGDHAVTPFDLAAASDGGVLVLDRVRRRWWRLDRHWRLLADVAEGARPWFGPADDGSGPSCPAAPEVAPRPRTLDASGPLAVVDPVAITEGPGVVLVLDRPPAGPSAVVVCDAGPSGGVRARLPLTVEALDPARPDLPSFVHDVVGHDLAWGPAGTATPLPGPLLYVADARTSGTEAYRLDLDPPALVHQADELPMRAWEAKAVVAAGGDVFYDAVGRWVPLEPFGICNRERTATVSTPAGFVDGVAGQPFDSAIPGCGWHRLFLDAEIPDGCRVVVEARASDDPALLERLPLRSQPDPYLRSNGAELAWHDPWADLRRPPSPRTGTWELLFQQVVGRYLQVALTLHGTGRTTPSLRALRAWYPRFSYVAAYLPEVYAEADEPARFTERFLANPEGLLTEHEARIDGAWRLVDPDTAPTAALDWLASWVGLHLEPAWSTARRRFLLRHVDRLYRLRGTVGGLRALLRLYLGCSLDPDVVFAPGPRTDDPARIVEGIAPHRFRVLVAARLDAARAAMVERIVEASRPGHAAFEIRAYRGLLVVGEARVGLDTVVGDSPGFEPIVLDASALPGLAGAAHPFEIRDRIVSDRDRLGELPPL